jgi:hypothetical protein
LLIPLDRYPDPDGAVKEALLELDEQRTRLLSSRSGFVKPASFFGLALRLPDSHLSSVSRVRHQPGKPIEGG